MAQFKHLLDSRKPVLEVPDTETTRIAILTRSRSWQRIDQPEEAPVKPKAAPKKAKDQPEEAPVEDGA